MHEYRLRALQGAEKSEISRRAEAAHEGINLVLRGKLRGDRGRGVRLAFRVLGDEFDLTTEDAPSGILLIGRVLDAPEDLRTATGERAGKRQRHADLDRCLLRFSHKRNSAASGDH